MKNFIIVAFSSFSLIASIGVALADTPHGSNPDGSEKVCALGMGAQSEPGISEGLSRCKRGDILDIGWAKIAVAMQVCDFTKAIVYHPQTGAIIACVYTGSRRGTTK